MATAAQGRRQWACLSILVTLFPVVAAGADGPPRRYPLIAVDAGQDAEDVAAGIDPYHAAFEAFSLSFEPGDAGTDVHGSPLAESVTVEFDGALAAEMGLDVGADQDLVEPVRHRLDAPGRGWAIDRTYAIPYTPGLVLSAHFDEGDEPPDPHDRLVFLRADVEGLEIVHQVDAWNKLDVPEEDRPLDWPFPTWPAVLETGLHVPSSRVSVWDEEQQRLVPPPASRPLASLIYDGKPAALDDLLPPGASVGFSEAWWRDEVRLEHLSRVEGVFWTLTNAALLLETLGEEGGPAGEATTAALARLKTLTGGEAGTPAPEELVGTWRARLLTPDVDGGVAASPLGSLTVAPERGDVRVDGGKGDHRLSGRLYRFTHGVEGSVFLGSRTTNGTAPPYSGWSGPFDLPAPETDAVGVVYGLSDDHAVLVLDADDPLDWKLVDLERGTDAGAHAGGRTQIHTP